MKLLLLLSFVALSFSLRRFDGDQVLTLYPQTEEHLALIREFDSFDTLADFWSPDNVEGVRIGRSVDIRFKSLNLRVVKKKMASVNMNYDIKIEDVQELIDNQFNIARTKAFDISYYSVYHTYDEIVAWSKQMSIDHPDIASYDVLTQSYGNKDIPMLVLGSNPDTTPVVIVDCGIHAREWVSPAFCQCYVDRMLTGYGTDPEITSTLDKFTLIVLPVLNVDGYQYSWTDDRMWRKTRSNYGTVCTGVDPNRNFDAVWSGPGASSNPCSETYYGPVVESEPLTQGLTNLVKSYSGKIEAYMTFHSYSQFIIIPYSCMEQSVVNGDDHLYLASMMSEAIRSVHGKRYDYGIGHEAFYLAAGGSDDMTVIGGHAKYSFTVELRDTGRYGFILPEDQIIPTCEENFELMDTLFTQLKTEATK